MPPWAHCIEISSLCEQWEEAPVCQTDRGVLEGCHAAQGLSQRTVSRRDGL